MLHDFFEMLNPRYNKRVMGALTIFLMILMTPFVTIAFVTCEVARYKNTINQVDEAMGLSTMAILANYDSFLQDRFGLYACTQNPDVDLEGLYQVYMTENLTGLRSSMSSFDGCSVTGMYPLSDMDVFSYQINEYLLLNGPTTLLNEVFNIDSILSCFDSIKSFQDIVKKVNKGVETADAAAEACNDAQAVKDIISTISATCVPTYNTKYNDLKNAVNAYATKAAETVPTVGSLTGEAKATVEAQITAHENALATLAATITTCKTNYANSIQDIIDKLNDVKTKLAGWETNYEKLTTNLTSYGNDYFASVVNDPNKDAQKALQEEMDLYLSSEKDSYEYEQLQNRMNELKDEATANSNALALQSAFTNSAASWENATSTVSTTTIDTCIQKLTEMKGTVEAYDYINSTPPLNDTVLHYVTVSDYISEDMIDSYFEEQKNATQTDDKDSWTAFLDSISSFCKKLLKAEAVYDSAKSATINVDYYTQNGLFAESEDSEKGIAYAVTCIIAMCDSFGALVVAFLDIGQNPITYLYNLFVALGNALSSIVTAVEAVISCVSAIISRIQQIAENGISQTVFQGMYACYGMSCRTGGPLIGKAVSGACPTAGKYASSDIPFVGDIAALLNLDDTGSQYAFCGCELEYILYGQYDEISNQAFTFLSLYFLRLLVDGPQVWFNTEVQAIADAAAASTVGIGYFPVMLITMFAEPLVDTLLLVNSASVPLVKTKFYLTPSGLPDLVKAFSSFKLTDGLKDEVVGKAYDAYRIDSSRRDAVTSARPTDSKASGMAKWAEGLLNLNYRDHLLILYLLLPDTEENIRARIYNIVVMEGNQYYKTKKSADYVFDLKKSYTMLNTTADVSFSPFLADTYSDYSVFSISRAIYRGY